MLRNKFTIPGLLLGLLIVAVMTVPAMAEDSGDEKGITIIRHGGGSLTLDTDGDILRVVHVEDGEERIVELDLDQMGLMMEDVLADMGGLMAELDNMQMTFKLGQDNRLSFTQDDSYWELDLDEIMAQVGGGLEGLGDEFDMDDWTRHSRQHHYESGSDDLQDELDDLRQEVRALKRELQELREK